MCNYNEAMTMCMNEDVSKMKIRMLNGTCNLAGKVLRGLYK